MKRPYGDFLTVREYSEKHGIAKDTVWHWITRKKIEAIKVNGHWFISSEAKPDPNANRHRAFKAKKIIMHAWSGKEIRQARLSLNISQRTLGEIAGVSWQTVSRIERECFEKTKMNTALLLSLVLAEMKRNKIYSSLNEETNGLGYARPGA